MKVGDPNEAGDLVQLKRLCGDYGLDRATAATSRRTASVEECGPGKCESECAFVCLSCYIKP